MAPVASLSSLPSLSLQVGIAEVGRVRSHPHQTGLKVVAGLPGIGGEKDDFGDIKRTLIVLGEIGHEDAMRSSRIQGRMKPVFTRG